MSKVHLFHRKPPTESVSKEEADKALRDLQRRMDRNLFRAERILEEVYRIEKVALEIIADGKAQS